MNGMCRKLFLLTFAVNKISCDEFYNMMKSNPDLTTSLYDQYERDSGDLNEYEDLLEEESKDEEMLDDENYVESRERAEERTFQKQSSGCSVKYETVSVVKQVPSFSKHCHKVEDTKCKTVYKNAFETKMETQCVASFDTSCEKTVSTAFKQECKTIKDVECRIVNLEDSSGGHHSEKLCEDVPTEKCVPVPFKVEGQQCVNIPVQQCSNVPVTGPVEVPKERCYKRPRRVCQTLVSTKPKVVTAQVPREVCGHSAPAPSSGSPAPVRSTSSLVPSPGSSISRSFSGDRSKEQETGGYYGEQEETGGYYEGEKEETGGYYGEQEKTGGYFEGEKEKSRYYEDDKEKRGYQDRIKEGTRNWKKEQKDLFYYLMNQKN